MSSKSKKKGEKVLLLPGADGWEVWVAGPESNGFVLSQRSGAVRVLDVAGIPPGELTMAFPVRDVSALPFRAPTSDQALLSDLAEMHLERMGVRPGTGPWPPGAPSIFSFSFPSPLHISVVH